MAAVDPPDARHQFFQWIKGVSASHAAASELVEYHAAGSGRAENCAIERIERLRFAGEDGRFPERKAVYACSAVIASDFHAACGERTRLVGADHRRRPECFDARQPADERVVASEPPCSKR